MARARNIKPKFFLNETLAECSAHARLLFIGLWTICDGDGRLEDRPRRIKAEVFPYEDVDVSALLDELERHSFVSRYEVNGIKVIAVPNFRKHQRPHGNEPKNVLPPNKSEKVPSGSEQIGTCSEQLRQNPTLPSSLNAECGMLNAESSLPLSEEPPAAPSGSERESLDSCSKATADPPTASEAWSMVDSCLDIRESRPATMSTDEARQWAADSDKRYRMAVLGLPPPVRKLFQENKRMLEDRKRDRSSKCGIFKSEYKKFLDALESRQQCTTSRS